MTKKLPTDINAASRKVLAQLRPGPLTVDEVARALRLTHNAVRNQLRHLEEAGLAERRGRRAGVSKPSVLYAITLLGQVQFSTLYLPVLAEFLRTAEGRCAGKQLTTFMRHTGKSLAGHYPKPSGALHARISSAARLIRGFGGLMQVEKVDGSMVLRSKACPLAALTTENSAACRVIEGFVTEYASASVRTCCDVGDDPRCCFKVKGKSVGRTARA